jgi:hypothetical protein
MNKKSHNDDDEDEIDEENVAVSKIEYWHLTVHVHGKEIDISAGDATQRVKWLAHVAIARWDDENGQGWKRLGVPLVAKLRNKNGPDVDLSATIRDVLRNGDHIYIETSLAPNETRS